MSRDYYDILGVSKQASADEVKKAFRKKAHELHPDKGGDETAFKEVNEAYQILGDAEKRATYDQFGRAAFDQGAGGGPNGFGGFNRGFRVNMEDMGDLGDLFGNMFGFGARGSGRSARGTRRGGDIEVAVELSFMESVKGVEKTISYRALCLCEACKGLGAEKGAGQKTCEICKGSGQVIRAQQTILGTFQAASVCETCRGTGKIPERVCQACRGRGVIGANQTLTVSIPVGMDDGGRLRLSGKGEAAPYGGSAGDLYLHIRVRRDARFVREEDEILSDANVPFTILLLGGVAEVETVDGVVDLQIPQGTAAGTVFRLREKGVPHLHGRGRGDHLVTVKPKIEKKLSHNQKALLERLRESGL